MYISICTLPYQLLNRTENKCLCSSTAPSACGRMLANKRGRSVQGNNIKMSPASFRLPASNSLFINHAFFTDLTDITVHSLGEAKQYESFTFDDKLLGIGNWVTCVRCQSRVSFRDFQRPSFYSMADQWNHYTTYKRK